MNTLRKYTERQDKMDVISGGNVKPLACTTFPHELIGKKGGEIDTAKH